MPLPGATYLWDRVTNENRAAVEARDLGGWRQAYAERLPLRRDFVESIASWDEITVVDVRPFWTAPDVAEGAVLIGDAAGTVHPHTAQGASLALEGALAVGDARASALAAQAAPLRGLVGRQRALLDAAGPLRRAARASGYAWNRIAPARRALLRQTAGLR